jgi:hypothetical protein
MASWVLHQAERLTVGQVRVGVVTYLAVFPTAVARTSCASAWMMGMLLRPAVAGLGGSGLPVAALFLAAKKSAKLLPDPRPAACWPSCCCCCSNMPMRSPAAHRLLMLALGLLPRLHSRLDCCLFPGGDVCWEDFSPVGGGHHDWYTACLCL